MSYRIIQGDAVWVLRGLPDESVHCCVTSPPYWGLRDYKLEPLVWGGAAGCEHEWGEEQVARGPAQEQGATSQRKGRTNIDEQRHRGVSQGCWCSLCGAWRGSLGLEPTPELYTQHLVEIMREVRRVLRNDGTLWLNLGDSYAGGGNGGHQKGEYFHGHTQRSGDFTGQAKKAPPGLKPKDLVGIPWMAAFALRTDGWWLRSDIIWSKPNPMPESVRDRPTKAHEYIFLLTKSAKCYYDAEAIKEPAICGDPRKPYCPGQVDGRGDGHARGGGKIRASVLRGGFNGKTEFQPVRGSGGLHVSQRTISQEIAVKRLSQEMLPFVREPEPQAEQLNLEGTCST